MGLQWRYKQMDVYFLLKWAYQQSVEGPGYKWGFMNRAQRCLDPTLGVVQVAVAIYGLLYMAIYKLQKNEDPTRWTQFLAESSYNDKRIYSRNLQWLSLSWRLN